MYQKRPYTTNGIRIGLLGGSFDPPHAGHLHISKWALKKFDLDFIWWLISPGNPLKEQQPASLDRRLNACNKLIDHPRIIATNFESQFKTRYTIQTLNHIRKRYSRVRFMWLMGADNLANFHHWKRWADIMHLMPIGVLARPGYQLSAANSLAAQRFQKKRLTSNQSTCLAFHPAPCWCLITGSMLDISSSQIRSDGEWIR